MKMTIRKETKEKKRERKGKEKTRKYVHGKSKERKP